MPEGKKSPNVDDIAKALVTWFFIMLMVTATIFVAKFVWLTAFVGFCK